MERYKELLENIDGITDELLKNDEEVYKNLSEILPLMGEVLAKCIEEIERIKEAGFDIEKEDVEYAIIRLQEAIEKRDNMKLIDVLCFEVYGMVEGYVNGR